MALGETLKQARIRRNLTISEVSRAIQVPFYIIEGIEKDDFRRIAAPIYAKGFIKLYAQHVGLDPKPLIEEYMVLHAEVSTPSAEHPNQGEQSFQDTLDGTTLIRVARRMGERMMSGLNSAVANFRKTLAYPSAGQTHDRSVVDENISEDQQPSRSRALSWYVPTAILIALLLVILFSAFSSWARRTPRSRQPEAPRPTMLRPVMTAPEPYFERGAGPATIRR